MKNYILILAIAISLTSCVSKDKNVDLMRFREGSFEIPAGDKYGKTSFIRKDTLQIETYNDRVDSLSIYWKDNFNYTLKMLHPKSDLDKEPIRVKITSIKKDSYEFEAIIGHSNFIQKGTVNKIEN